MLPRFWPSFLFFSICHPVDTGKSVRMSYRFFTAAIEKPRAGQSETRKVFAERGAVSNSADFYAEPRQPRAARNQKR